MGLCISYPFSSSKKDLQTRAATTKNHANGTEFSTAASESFNGIMSDSGRILESPNLKVYSFLELKTATKNFKSDLVLGQGGFGRVYRGCVDAKTLAPSKAGSGMIVAVKRLDSESLQGFEEWRSEVNFSVMLSHPNLVKLLGYCREDKELLLVYEFMPNGSLANHLFGPNEFPWDLRMKIAIDAAHGLAFLHGSERKVIHRNLKSSNILLDSNYNAKLSDFGLAKLGPSQGKSHVTTRVMGTYGYAAPEYMATGHLYVKSDVYIFGVVLLEIMTGLKAVDPSRPYEKQNLVEWLRPKLSSTHKIQKVMDKRIRGQCSTKVATEMGRVALSCIEPEPKKRPHMVEVVEILNKLM